MQKKINLGLIGLGYWGPNIARVLMESDRVNSLAIFDIDSHKTKLIADRYSQIRAVENETAIFDDPKIEAIIISTPVSTHTSLVKKGLKNGKHIFCEKPISINSEEVLEIKSDANSARKIVMVGHVFEYNSIVKYMQQELAGGALGKIFYLDFNRNGLGPIREDVNVIADLASHDISIANFLLSSRPIAVSAMATSFFNNSKEDIASIHLQYPSNVSANIHVSWLDPIKQRQVKIVAEKKMLLFDDVSTQEKLKIVETGKHYQDSSGSFASFQHKTKDGDVTIPNVEYKEPLAEEINHFLDCVLWNKSPLTDIDSALRVTNVLEAISISIKNEGKRVYL